MKKFLNKIKNSDFIQTYKEEIIVIPTILLGFFLINQFFIFMFPTGAFFDYVSEIETLVNRALRVFVALFVAHLGLRMSFPAIYKYMHKKIYFNFNSLPEESKIKYSVIFIITFIITTALIFA